jgi:hypothetical protein
VPLLTPALEQTSAMNMAGFQALYSLPLAEADLLADRLEEAHAIAERALALPVGTRNEVTRRMPCASSWQSR